MTQGEAYGRRRLPGAGEAEVIWYLPTGADELRRLLPEGEHHADLDVLSGESRVEVRVRGGRVALRAFEIDENQQAAPLAMLCLPTRLYIFAQQESSAARELMEGAEELGGPAAAFWQAWENIVSGYQAASEATVASAEQVAQRVLVGPQRGLGHITYRVRRRAFALRQAVQRAQAIFAVLAGELPAQWGGDADRLCREISQRIARAYADIESVRESLGETVEAYTSVQSNEMTHVMQVMTIVSLLFLPPTLIASIYGMNFRIPEYGWPQGYAWSLGLMVALTGLTLVWAARRKWLR